MGIKVKKNKKVISSKERELRRQRARAKETLLMYKFLFVTVAMLIGIAAVLTIRNNGAVTLSFLTHAQLPLVIVFAILTVAAAIWFVISKRKKLDESNRVITSTSMLAVAFSAFALMLSYSYVDMAYDTARIIALIVLAALYFVYHIYDAVFFTVSSQCALGVLALGILSKATLSTGIRIAVAVLVIAVCSVGAYLLHRFLAKGEALKSYKFYLMTAIIIAGALLSLFIPAISSYAVFALLAVYVIIAVISTIELM